MGLQHRILASVARRQHFKPVQKCGGAKSANCCVWARASYTLVDTCSARAPVIPACDGAVAFGWPSSALSHLRSADQRSEAAANISKCRGVLAGDQHRDEWTSAYRSRTRPNSLEKARAATLLRIRTAVRSGRTNR
jgi:hypothetical protein